MDGPAQEQQQQDDFSPPAATADDAAYADDFDAEPQQQQQPAAAPAGSSAAAERDWLVADKQQQLYDEMLGMGVKRGELLSLLAELGQSAAEDETAVSGDLKSNKLLCDWLQLLWSRVEFGVI
jgi:hypothetical protein